MKTLHSVQVRGHSHYWVVITKLDKEAVEDMRADGLMVYELMYRIPVWVADLGLAGVWCFFTNVFHFRRPW